MRLAIKKKPELLPAPAHLATKRAGCLGVKNHQMYPILIHLWGRPILHGELVMVKDWLTRLEKFADCRVEMLPPEKVARGEHLIIRTNDLEDLLFESKERQPKESIKELEEHMARLEKETRERTKTRMMHPRLGEPTIIPD
jgi:hypothetical protein